ncbi:hypothetical protein WAI453_013234 [Rhynchosporium graminicola]
MLEAAWVELLDVAMEARLPPWDKRSCGPGSKSAVIRDTTYQGVNLPHVHVHDESDSLGLDTFTRWYIYNSS